ncbi:MAG: hypothetical protein HYR55_09745 [Acidobacteria bacterium]|nr:hypothetical protein [Acidobacteriota bacterium]MBI3657548.1 hypothetical protein [Acidobacteriota bacterium]
MKRLFPFVGALVFFVLSLSGLAAVRDFEGDLRTLIPAIKTHMRQVAGPGTNRFVVPTTRQMNTWRTAIRAVLDQDLDTADRLLSTLATSYKIIRFTDTTENRTYYLLLEANLTKGITPIVEKGWGTFIFDPDPQRLLSLQVPHPIFDADTDREGIEIFLHVGAGSFLMSGTHRCANSRASQCTTGTTAACGGTRAIFRESDVAHNVATLFHQTHAEIVTKIPETTAIQIHGNNGAGCPDALISNTNGDYTTAEGGNIQTLAGYMEGGDFEVRICDPRPSVCNLCGAGNMQGRFTNGSTNPCTRSASSSNEQFIHIEQSRQLRQDYSALIDAILQTFP